MDVKPQRPARARSLRVRPDENQVPVTKQNAKDVQNNAVGIKGAARRAFGDVSNSRALGQRAASNGKVSITVEKPQKGVAVSKPAQRVPGLKNAPSTNTTNQYAVSTQQAGPRRVTKKTAVYEDKRPSPKRISPKRVSPRAARTSVGRKKSNLLPAVRQNAKRSQVSARPLSGIARVKHEEIKDEPVYSDQHPHLYDENYVDIDDDDVLEVEEDDITEPEDDIVRIDEKARFNSDVVSDYGSEEEEDDHTDHTSARSRAGDNTTGVTTQVLVPKWTSKARREISKLQDEFVSYDEEDEGDISMVAEYGDEIFEYMRELENKLLPNAHYMDFQSEIQWSMRAILMDWLVQVHARFNLLPETMFLCTNYIDRFLSAKVVSLGKLQLVGATALFVAAKYEEINCPSVHEIVYMVDGGYTAEEILKAERFMLSMLHFELGWPGPMSFLRRVSKADDYDLETRTLAKYFLEITIMDERFVGSPPSFLAAGAHCLARHMLKKGEWTPAHAFYSGYTAAQLEPLVHTLVECCENPKEHHNAVFEKYADRRYKRASLYVANWMAQQGSCNDE